MRSDDARVSVAVMTHPGRIDRAHRLRRRHPELDMTIVVDPEPEGPPSALRSGLRAWAAIADDATHHLVLQDDVALAPAFAANLVDAVRAMPHSALCLFTEWGSRTSYALRISALRGSPWAPAIDEYIPSVALVLPAAHARAFSESAPRATTRYDVAVHDFLSRAGVRAWVSVPNLSDHLDGPSVAGNDTHGVRRSACYLADVGAPSGWSRITPGGFRAVPCFSWRDGFPWYRVEDAGTDRGWRLAAFKSRFRELGLDVARVLEEGTACLAGSPTAARLGPRLTLALWLTAFAIGVEFGVADGGETPVDQALRRSAAKEAIATMPGGALRTLVSAETLRRVERHLAGALEEAIVRGCSEFVWNGRGRSR